MYIASRSAHTYHASHPSFPESTYIFDSCLTRGFSPGSETTIMDRVISTMSSFCIRIGFVSRTGCMLFNRCSILANTFIFESGSSRMLYQLGLVPRARTVTMSLGGGGRSFEAYSTLQLGVCEGISSLDFASLLEMCFSSSNPFEEVRTVRSICNSVSIHHSIRKQT